MSTWVPRAPSTNWAPIVVLSYVPRPLFQVQGQGAGAERGGYGEVPNMHDI